jgi:hypothetical protein
VSPSVCLEYNLVWLFTKPKSGSADERRFHPDDVVVKLHKRVPAEIETVLGTEISRTYDKGAKKTAITELDPSQLQ